MDYIEREAAKDELLSWAVCINHPEYLMREDAIHALDDIPAADVAPVRHGWWELVEYQFLPLEPELDFVCSECGFAHQVDCWYNYCPECGAKMDGGRDG